jgi:hypothetical protein
MTMTASAADARFFGRTADVAAEANGSTSARAAAGTGDGDSIPGETKPEAEGSVERDAVGSVGAGVDQTGFGPAAEVPATGVTGAAKPSTGATMRGWAKTGTTVEKRR